MITLNVFYRYKKNEPVHDKTTIRRASAQSDQSPLIICTFYSLRAIQIGMNEKPCHAGWIYRLLLSVCWSHRSYCRFYHALAQSIKYKVVTELVLLIHCLSQAFTMCKVVFPLTWLRMCVNSQLGVIVVHFIQIKMGILIQIADK